MTLIVFFSSRISPFTSTVIFLRKVARGDGGGHLGDVADLAGEVGRHRVDVVGEVLPGAGDALHIGLAAQFALGADLAGDAGHLRGEAVQLIDHRVHDLADAQELAAQRPAVDLDGHRLRQIALGHRADHARHFGGRLDHVLDQLVDRAQFALPAAGGAADAAALADLAFLADDDRKPLELLGHLLFEADDLVEQLGDLAVGAGKILGQANREVAAAKGCGARRRAAGDRENLAGKGRSLVAPSCGPPARIRMQVPIPCVFNSKAF